MRFDTEASKFKLREVISSVCCACTVCGGKGSDLFCVCVKANAEGTAMPLTFFSEQLRILCIPLMHAKKSDMLKA